MIVGLRIDVDTYRGTQLGVPRLGRILGERGIRASFFFSVGPDNMGRHLWRLARPSFLVKMLRSRAANLYGWSVLLRGTLWPGPVIGERLAGTIRAAADAGHEVGLHAWDHHAWQAHVDELSADEIRATTARAAESLARITGSFPLSSAAAGWRANERVLQAQSGFPFAYQSDCRGTSIFLPLVAGAVLARPQIPVTLPTYDEWIGREGVSDANYNERLLARLDPARLNVLTIHAEVEGGSRSDLFEDFLARASAAGWSFAPLGSLLPAEAELPVAPLVAGTVSGREGTVACQGRTERMQRWRAPALVPRTPRPV